jgi:hypothetical protein
MYTRRAISRHVAAQRTTTTPGGEAQKQITLHKRTQGVLTGVCVWVCSYTTAYTKRLHAPLYELSGTRRAYTVIYHRSAAGIAPNFWKGQERSKKQSKKWVVFEPAFL